MRYLTKEYWGYFEKKRNINDESKIQKDGEKFEDLIEELLHLLFENRGIIWTATKKTHDGNKDFVGEKNNEIVMWAECKNYQKKITLQTLAPTMIMAELNYIRKILIFSYSPINNNTKEKLIKYANIREKSIYYYDDENLEKLLFKFRSIIFPKYFPTFSNQEIKLEVVEPYIFSFSMPGLYYNNIEKIYSNSFTVKLNELIFMGIGIINNDYIRNVTFEISFHDINDLKYLEILDNSIKNSKREKWRKKIILSPGESKLLKIYFRPVLFKKIINLPSIRIESNNMPQAKILTFKRIRCDSLFRSPLLGAHYFNILKKLYKTTINKSKLSLAIIYGRSGVGKSRILNESLCEYKKNHYHILNFSMRSFSKTNDSIHIISELLYFVYNITYDMIIESEKYLCNVNFLSTEQRKIIELLISLEKKDEKAIHLLNEYQYIIFRKILTQKNLFIIDNIQFAESFLIDFIYNLSIFSINQRRNTNTVFLISYNNDYYINNDLVKLIYLVEQEKTCSAINTFYEEIIGMKDYELSLSYIKQLIHLDSHSDDTNLYLQEIAKKANHNPKYIENIIDFLHKNNSLMIKENYFLIRDMKAFYNSIHTLPNSFYNVFEQRFHLFLKNEKLVENQVIIVIAAIHFFSKLSYEEYRYYKFEKKILTLLIKYGFVNQEDDIYIQFNHDLYENYFIMNYELEEIFIQYILEKELDKAYLNTWQEVLVKIKGNHELRDIIVILLSRNITYQDVSFKIKKYFFTTVIDYFATNYTTDLSFNDYLSCINQICLNAKNNLGFDFSLYLFKTIYVVLSKTNINEREKLSSYREFINEYTENLLQINSNKVLNIYLERIRYKSQDKMPDLLQLRFPSFFGI